MNDILTNINNSQFFSIQTDESTDISVYQQCGLLLHYYDNLSVKFLSNLIPYRKQMQRDCSVFLIITLLTVGLYITNT